MGAAYRPEVWQSVYIAMCGAAATLTGLLFISTSLHVQGVMKAPVLRMRAYTNTVGATVLIVEAIVVLLPQDVVIIGLELFLINLLSALYLPGRVLLNAFRTKFKARFPLARHLWVWVAYFIGMAGGVSLMATAGGGFYLVTLHYCLGICLVIAGAWSLMVDVETSESKASP